MGIHIKNIAYHLPDKIISNDDIKKENPDWDMELIFQRSGVMNRHVALDNETALDLAVKACEKLSIESPEGFKSIDAIIFCSQSQDYIMPPNSCVLHKHLSLPDNVFAVDINSACSGFIHNLALAQGLIMSKSASNVLIINADTYSKYINPLDRSVRVLFGDAASACLVNNSEDHRGIKDILCATSGKDFEKFIIPAGGCRTPKSTDTNVPITNKSGNVRTLENIHMDGMGILTFVTSKVPAQIQEILKKNNLNINDIDLFIFHQASKLAVDTLSKILNLSPQKVHYNISEIGNVVSASIPISLCEALAQKKIKPGDKILISGFGVGLSWGTAIIQF
jgi:3-oxoacyl-[acyl-carrier-protein] synthase-3